MTPSLGSLPCCHQSAAGLPVRIEDVPPGWLATLADWAVIVAVAVALLTGLLTLRAMRNADKNAEPDLEVRASRDARTVYVRILNKGRMAAEVHKVYLGVLAPNSTEAFGDYNYHLRPNVLATTFTASMLAAKSSQLVTLPWPTEPITSWTRDKNGAAQIQAGIDPDLVHAIVRVYDGFKAARIEVESPVGEEEQVAPRAPDAD